MKPSEKLEMQYEQEKLKIIEGMKDPLLSLGMYCNWEKQYDERYFEHLESSFFDLVRYLDDHHNIPLRSYAFNLLALYKGMKISDNIFEISDKADCYKYTLMEFIAGFGFSGEGNDDFVFILVLDEIVHNISRGKPICKSKIPDDLRWRMFSTDYLGSICEDETELDDTVFMEELRSYVRSQELDDVIERLYLLKGRRN